VWNPDICIVFAKIIMNVWVPQEAENFFVVDRELASRLQSSAIRHSVT